MCVALIFLFKSCAVQQPLPHSHFNIWWRPRNDAETSSSFLFFFFWFKSLLEKNWTFSLTLNRAWRSCVWIHMSIRVFPRRWDSWRRFHTVVDSGWKNSVFIEYVWFSVLFDLTKTATRRWNVCLFQKFAGCVWMLCESETLTICTNYHFIASPFVSCSTQQLCLCS